MSLRWAFTNLNVMHLSLYVLKIKFLQEEFVSQQKCTFVKRVGPGQAVKCFSWESKHARGCRVSGFHKWAWSSREGYG